MSYSFNEKPGFANSSPCTDCETLQRMEINAEQDRNTDYYEARLAEIRSCMCHAFLEFVDNNPTINSSSCCKRDCVARANPRCRQECDRFNVVREAKNTHAALMKKEHEKKNLVSEHVDRRMLLIERRQR